MVSGILKLNPNRTNQYLGFRKPIDASIGFRNLESYPQFFVLRPKTHVIMKMLLKIKIKKTYKNIK
ncbi:MAG: hypothetical protein A2745_02805 [Candidatus Harrisonbacteria bacterium RIFCSPHIGHO2_01_FULL_44_13]|uniref:Uncharacterized protein n=1 Tax=Candidatus Harrisonbacteria bacterium RIFCSPLOWO2_01_FULL_44_18 TaxID=1798407 RepID=A0A1G1ZP49_9BACT|nr:MAG: hypothetical protein A2745_02805 [Candidatus Harrisonbacteria bacterium RIFCSPHIGHO2_01_FULL_44_13]OGY65510.1 MAG: hypothetical protein A3A16_01435 [Candidatus Harrisonbacteria bacterium RIFCSPLOWO2_01_FULL_44_18]